MKMSTENNLFDMCETPREAVFTALGAASVCWESLEHAGVFQSDRAKEIGLDLIDKLSELFDLGLGWE